MKRWVAFRNKRRVVHSALPEYPEGIDGAQNAFDTLASLPDTIGAKAARALGGDSIEYKLVKVKETAPS